MHMSKRIDAETLSTHVRSALRGDILSGKWAPGEKLQLTSLSSHYQTSSTVVREALTRLVGDRLVLLKANRGFFVPVLSLAELRDITELRCVNEQFAVSLAIERGDLNWEGELMAVHHRMEKTPSRDAENRPTIEWAAAHQAFHAQLLAACGVPVLIDLTNTLSDLTQLYNRWATSATNWSGRDLSAEHQAILDAALARDAETTSRLLAEHYHGTLEAITTLGVEVGLPATTA